MNEFKNILEEISKKMNTQRHEAVENQVKVFMKLGFDPEKLEIISETESMFSYVTPLKMPLGQSFDSYKKLTPKAKAQREIVEVLLDALNNHSRLPDRLKVKNFEMTLNQYLELLGGREEKNPIANGRCLYCFEPLSPKGERFLIHSSVL